MKTDGQREFQGRDLAGLGSNRFIPESMGNPDIQRNPEIKRNMKKISVLFQRRILIFYTQ